MRCVACGSSAVSERPERNRPGLPPVRLPHLWQTIQRTQRRPAEPNPPSDVIALVVLWRLRYKLRLETRPRCSSSAALPSATRRSATEKPSSRRRWPRLCVAAGAVKSDDLGMSTDQAVVAEVSAPRHRHHARLPVASVQIWCAERNPVHRMCKLCFTQAVETCSPMVNSAHQRPTHSRLESRSAIAEFRYCLQIRSDIPTSGYPCVFVPCGSRRPSPPTKPDWRTPIQAAGGRLNPSEIGPTPRPRHHPPPAVRPQLRGPDRDARWLAAVGARRIASRTPRRSGQYRIVAKGPQIGGSEIEKALWGAFKAYTPEFVPASVSRTKKH